MAFILKPEVGIIWYSNADPTVAPGVPAPPNQLLVRTDTNVMYYKSGGANTAWTSLGGGGITGVGVEDEGVPIGLGPYSEFNFVGAGVGAADVGGVATVMIPGGISGITVEDEGVPIANNPHTTLNFVGGGVSVTDVGGVGTVNVPTPAVSTAVAYLPEQWNQNGITAAQSQVPLSALVSINFDTISAVRAGSIVGIRTRINGGPVMAGNLKVTVSKNGAPGTLAVTSTSIANQNGGVAIQAAGVDTYAADDLLGVMVELASGDLAPAGTMNIEVQLQIAETI